MADSTSAFVQITTLIRQRIDCENMSVSLSVCVQCVLSPVEVRVIESDSRVLPPACSACLLVSLYAGWVSYWLEAKHTQTALFFCTRQGSCSRNDSMARATGLTLMVNIVKWIPPTSIFFWKKKNNWGDLTYLEPSVHTVLRMIFWHFRNQNLL